MVDYDEGERGHHPAVELFPVAPARANVKDCDDPVGEFEEFVASPFDGALGAEDCEESDEEHGEDAEDHVLLVEEVAEGGRLGFVEFAHDYRPDEGVEERLDEDDATAPAVEEIEVLVRDPSEPGEDALSVRE